MLKVHSHIPYQFRFQHERTGCKKQGGERARGQLITHWWCLLLLRPNKSAVGRWRGKVRRASNLFRVRVSEPFEGHGASLPNVSLFYNLKKQGPTFLDYTEFVDRHISTIFNHEMVGSGMFVCKHVCTYENCKQPLFSPPRLGLSCGLILLLLPQLGFMQSSRLYHFRFLIKWGERERERRSSEWPKQLLLNLWRWSTQQHLSHLSRSRLWKRYRRETTL